MMRKVLIIMPKYEMMYIVASAVSDDQIPSVTDGILKYLEELGAENIKEEKLGKKKLAYPVKKTRNGFYDVVYFDLDTGKVADLNKKVITNENIIRHLIVNKEEDLRRMQKDLVAQERMNKNRSEHAPAQKRPGKEEAPTPEEIDHQIEQALSEDLTKI